MSKLNQWKRQHEVKEAEALKAYCSGVTVYAIQYGDLYRLPPERLYSSHAPARSLFYRSLPYGYNGKYYI